MNTYHEITRIQEAVLTGNLDLFEHQVERLRQATKWQAHIRKIRKEREANHSESKSTGKVAQ